MCRVCFLSVVIAFSSFAEEPSRQEVFFYKKVEVLSGSEKGTKISTCHIRAKGFAEVPGWFLECDTELL